MNTKTVGFIKHCRHPSNGGKKQLIKDVEEALKEYEK